jgi:hypothetical protein
MLVMRLSADPFSSISLWTILTVIGAPYSARLFCAKLILPAMKARVSRAVLKIDNRRRRRARGLEYLAKGDA